SPHTDSPSACGVRRAAARVSPGLWPETQRSSHRMAVARGHTNAAGGVGVDQTTRRHESGEGGRVTMQRIAVVVYGVLAYACFFATFLYAIGFVGGFGVPRSIDSAATGPLAVALAVDVLLLAAFALQHSVMARPAFKRWWTQLVPEPAERSTYVLASSLALSF